MDGLDAVATALTPETRAAALGLVQDLEAGFAPLMALAQANP